MYISGIIGLVALAYGLYVRFSQREKIFYLPGASTVSAPSILRFAAIPIGITWITIELVVFVLPSFIQSDVVIQWLFICLVGPMVLATFWFAFSPPRWLLPDWINWLEDKYGPDVTLLMLDSVKEPKEWEQRVSTQGGLEAWAKEAWQQLQDEQGKNGRRP